MFLSQGRIVWDLYELFFLAELPKFVSGDYIADGARHNLSDIARRREGSTYD